MNRPNLQRIMYVEDEPDLRTIVSLSLREIGGFDVLACSSGIEALERAPVFQPQLVLLDVMMPGMDGPETLEALRELNECAETPMAFITAKINTAETERLLGFGAVDIIGKPFNPLTLHETVANIWERARAQQEPNNLEPDVTSEIVAITARFRERMVASVEELGAYRESLAGSDAAPNADTLDALCMLAHRLNGSGTTFGFAKVSASAASLEATIQDCQNGADISAEGVLKHLDNLVTQLQTSIADEQPAEPIRSETRLASSHPNP